VRPERCILLSGRVGIETWLKGEQVYVLAWTVNDLTRVNELVRLGVDAMTTDNLAIMELLGGQRRGERLLVRRALPSEARQQPPSDEAQPGSEQQRPGKACLSAPYN